MDFRVADFSYTNVQLPVTSIAYACLYQCEFFSFLAIQSKTPAAFAPRADPTYRILEATPTVKPRKTPKNSEESDQGVTSVSETKVCTCKTGVTTSN